MNMQKINKKIELEKQIEQTHLEISQVPHVGRLREQAGFLANAVVSFHKQYYEEQTPHGATPTVIDFKIKEEMAERKERAAAALEDVKKSEESTIQLHEKLSFLKNELSELGCQVTEEDIVRLQSKKDEIETSIEKVMSAIESEEEKLSIVDADSDNHLCRLIDKKESLLADMAISNEIDEKELKSIDKKIVAEKKKVATIEDNKIKIGHILSGLKTKLTKYEKELSSVDRQYFEAFEVFLLEKAKRAGNRYADSAKELFAAFMEIDSIERIFKQCGIQKRLLGFSATILSIPGASVCPPAKKSVNGLLYHGAYTHDKQALLKVKAHLAKSGIDIPNRRTEQ